MTTETSNARGEALRFRKKPVVIEAMQYPCEHPALRRCDCDPNWPHTDGPAPPQACTECGHVFIETLEGRMRVSPGDWIIRGVQGEFYPCKPEIFAATYEPADAAPPPAAAQGDVRGLDRLGWVRRAAIERLRNDLDVTGVMVHDEERTDSVPVYLAAEGAQAGEVEQQPEARGVVDAETALDLLDAACMNDKKVSWHGYTRDDRVEVMRRFLTALTGERNG